MIPERLTRKEFVAALKGTRFIDSIFGKSEDFILNAIDNTADRLSDPNNTNSLGYIYEAKEIVVHSSYLDSITETGDLIRRDLLGKNKFFRYRGFLVHQHNTCHMINQERPFKGPNEMCLKNK